MAFPLLIPAAITAAASLGSGYLQGRSQRKEGEKTRAYSDKLGKKQLKFAKEQAKETKLQRTQRHLVDELLSSITGKGKYSHLFKPDLKNNELFDPSNEAFQKSYVEPAQAMFKNQIAPQIQQQYIASGQQYGTGLEDQLLRAGVDLDQMLNQNFMQFQESAKNRQQNSIENALNRQQGALSNVFGQRGAQNPSLIPNSPYVSTPSTAQNLQSSLAGYLSSPGFSTSVKDIYKEYTKDNKASRPGYVPISSTTFPGS